MDDLNKFIDMVITAIDTRQNKKAKPRTVQAKVLRVDPDGTVWVNVPGGAPETPCVASTASCRRDDLVQCQISNGKGTVIGNMTRKATDDEKAIQADEKASAAGTLAEEAQTTAEEANELAYDTAQHLWTKETGGTPDCPTGTYVTEVPQEEFDPEKGGTPTGANVLIRSAGIFLRMAAIKLLEIASAGMKIFSPADTTNPSAQFLNTKTVIGKETGIHLVLENGEVSFWVNSTTKLFEFGVQTGTTNPAVYIRKQINANYSSELTFYSAGNAELSTYYDSNMSAVYTGCDSGIAETAIEAYSSDNVDGAQVYASYDSNTNKSAVNISADDVALSNIACGSVTLTTTPNTRVSQTVTFDSSKKFSGVPHVVVTPVSTAPDNIKGCTVASVSSTGFTIWLCRTDSSTTVVHWIAME